MNNGSAGCGALDALCCDVSLPVDDHEHNINGQYRTIKKAKTPPCDSNTYVHYLAPNGLQCLLIADAKTSLTTTHVHALIQVGSHHEPPEVLGLAHLLEHMLFMGSQNFPSSSAFDEYLSTHGGDSNAATSSDCTEYYFSCNQDGLRGALWRFHDLLFLPIFPEAGIQSEIEAIDSEFCLAQESEDAATEHLLGHLLFPTSPAGRFSWGNAASFKCHETSYLRRSLVAFHERHYKYEQVKLVIYAASHDTHAVVSMLEDAGFCTEIPDTIVQSQQHHSVVAADNGKSEEDAKQSKSGIDQQGETVVYHIEKATAGHALKIIWHIPSSLNTTPIFMYPSIVTVLESQAAGALHNELFSKGWAFAVDVDVEPYDFGSECSLCCITIDLTHVGYLLWTSTVTTVSAYIRQVLQQYATSTWLLFEIRSRHRQQWNLLIEPDMQSLTARIAIAMQDKYAVEVDDLITSSYASLEPPDMSRLTAYIDCISRDPDVVCLLTNTHDDVCKHFSYVDKWFGTRYQGPHPLQAKCTTMTQAPPAGHAITYRGPASCKYPCPDLSTVVRDTSSDLPSCPDSDTPTDASMGCTNRPIFLHATRPHVAPLGWYMHIPRNGTSVQIACSFVSLSKIQQGPGGQRYEACEAIFFAILIELLGKLVEDLQRCGASLIVDYHTEGWSLELTGAREVLEACSEDVFTILYNQMASIAYGKDDVLMANMFGICREYCVRELQNTGCNASSLAEHMHDVLCSTWVNDYMNTIDAMNGCNFADFRSWAQHYLKDAFCHIFLACGDVNAAFTEFIQNAVEDYFPYNATAAHYRQICPVHTYYKEIVHGSVSCGIGCCKPSRNMQSHCTDIFLEWGHADSEMDVAALMLLENIIEEPFYAYARTERHMGYDVSVSSSMVLSRSCVCFHVQSATVKPSCILQCIFDFITSLPHIIQDCDEEAYNDVAKSIVESLTEKSQNVDHVFEELNTELDQRYFGETAAAFKFDRLSCEVATQIPKVSRSLLLSLVQERLVAKNLRKAIAICACAYKTEDQSLFHDEIHDCSLVVQRQASSYQFQHWNCAMNSHSEHESTVLSA